jgi:sulfate transport system ATP-binding protein
MGFLGEITRLGDTILRPHDIEVSVSPLDGSVLGSVSRVLRIGFEVRVTVEVPGAQDVVVVMTRSHARSLGLDAGTTVWLRPEAGATTVAARGEIVEQVLGAGLPAS